MDAFFSEFLFFGTLLSLSAYWVGSWLQKKLKSPLCNPLLIAILLCIGFLLLTGTSYETYQQSAQLLSDLLTPATVCLAIPLYQQLQLLRQHWPAILAGLLLGVLTSLGCIYGLSALFGLDRVQYISLLPKSITTAIGLGLSAQYGGIPAFTAAAIIITGILGNILARPLCRLFGLHHPVAKGLAIGCASHAIGTTKAMELGETEGAMSSLAIAISGILTAALMGAFAGLPLS